MKVTAPLRKSVILFALLLTAIHLSVSTVKRNVFCFLVLLFKECFLVLSPSLIFTVLAL